MELKFAVYLERGKDGTGVSCVQQLRYDTSGSSSAKHARDDVSEEGAHQTHDMLFQAYMRWSVLPLFDIHPR